MYGERDLGTGSSAARAAVPDPPLEFDEFDGAALARPAEADLEGPERAAATQRGADPARGAQAPGAT